MTQTSADRVFKIQQIESEIISLCQQQTVRIVQGKSYCLITDKKKDKLIKDLFTETEILLGYTE